MAEKLSKTARASLGRRGERGSARLCPKCGNELTPAKVVRSANYAGGMYWICDQDDFMARIGS